MATQDGMGFDYEKLTRRHGVKVAPAMACSVEECALAVGAIVGHMSVKSASRMNSAIVLFLDCVEKVNSLVEPGIVLNDTHTQVFPLVTPARRVTLSNVPPFLRDAVLERELSRHGQLVSAIKKLHMGGKSALMRHAVSHRRQVHMILKQDNEELNIAFRFKIEGFDYVIYATTERMKCFGCGREGHLVRSCPQQGREDQQESVGAAPPVEHPSATLQEGQIDSGGEGVSVEISETASRGKELGLEGASDSGPGMECGERASRTGEETVLALDVVESLLAEQTVEQMEEEKVFKVPAIKRKSGKAGSKAKRNSKRASHANSQTVGQQSKEGQNTVVDSSASDSEGTSSDSSFNSGRESGYKLERIRSFLENTKGKKNVQVEAYFSDRVLFIESALTLMKNTEGECLTSQEIYRLKKIVQKLRQMPFANEIQLSQS